ncbi:hypothetical protein H0O02_03790 [Candidatus Micrarchaeota archaeon]|nr:hypothetical protein [Candidatus Micrarchaeota archaeon]
MNSKKGQVSTELLVIVGLVLVVFIPLLTLVYFKATEANEQIAAYQAELLVFRLAYLANSVGSLGTNSTIYTDLYIPQDIVYLKSATFGNGGEITLKLLTIEGETEISEVVKYPIKDAGTLAEGPAYGWARFRITSVYEGSRGQVEISRE